ncbi:DivIVA domain-containing protein [Luteipulveratus halotolerans]|uniref:Antigen 84 n=1 Tax=Luteipulveratus halotolerans TaxID=1631356 RepID=A0A0L6CL16_9MICO|nr:DivIVA domain-containing protein [Luteipulveratus halotolerans]KNX38424.1 hypothetical protein VV01_16760 [Luteipulveratus halotolerans]
MTMSDTPLFFDSGPQRPERVSLPVLDELTFARSGDGYDPDEVDAFVEQLRGVLDAAEHERTALRADLAQARDQIGGQDNDEIRVDAVGLLSQAQLIADKCIADAETYSRDLMMTARSQYREILERAEEKAAQTAEDVEGATSAGATAAGATAAGAASADATAAEAASASGAAAPEPVVSEVEYVRTYARVAQVQLRAVLDALAEQVDALTELPKPDRPAPAARPAGLSAAPAPVAPEAVAVPVEGDASDDDAADAVTGDVQWDPREVS